MPEKSFAKTQSKLQQLGPLLPSGGPRAWNNEEDLCLVCEYCRIPLLQSPHLNLFHVYLGKRRYDKAIAALQEQFKLEGRTQGADAIGQSYKRAGFGAALQTMIEIDEKSSSQDYDPFEVATAYSFLGNKDRAFVWLGKAVEARSNFVISLNVDPTWDNIRSDPRFEELVRRIGLPQ